MTPKFENVLKRLRQLPGLGYRSAERIALNLLVEQPEKLELLLASLQDAAQSVKRCDTCGNLSEEALCEICQSSNRNPRQVCIVETIPDLYAIERSGYYSGTYHVLHGKLSPVRGVGVDSLNFPTLAKRIKEDSVDEIILALDNDIESEATCHYIQDNLVNDLPISVSRIGFGLPSGGGIVYADSATLKSALDSRKQMSTL